MIGIIARRASVAKGQPIGEDMRDNLDRVFAAVYQDDRLTQWERDFISDLIDRLDEYGERMFLSPAQWDIIERIREKCEVKP
jgi:hypothetical protein